MSIATKKINIESLAVISMCMYVVLMAISYISPTLARLQSISLYAFLGLSIITAMFRAKLNLNAYFIWYIGFVILSLFAALYSVNPTRSLSTLSNVVIVLLIVFSMFVVLNSQKRIELLLKCLILGSVILFAYLFATGQLNIDTEKAERLGNELTGNANIFASIYMWAACSSVYFVMSDAKFWRKLFYLIVLLMQMYALSLSGGRKFFLVPLIVMFLMLLLKQDKKGRKHVIIYSIIGGIVAVVLYNALMNVPILYDTVGHRFESFVDYSTGASHTSDASTLERERMRERAIELWKQAPLFGHGYNAFSQLSIWGVYSHCNYTELLCNYGLVGFLYYYAFFIYLLWHLIKVKSNHSLKRFSFGIVLSILIYDYGAVSYADPLTQIFIFISALCINESFKSPTSFAQIDSSM